MSSLSRPGRACGEKTPRNHSGLLFGEHRFPARQLRLHEAADLLGRRVLGDEAHVVEALADLGARERGAELGVQPEDDLSRRARWREHAAPAREVVAWDAGLDRGGHVRKDALRSGVVTARARSVPALMCPPE